MWKSKEERKVAVEDMVNSFKKVFEKALIDKDIEAIERMIYELNRIREVWEFCEVIKMVANSTKIIDAKWKTIGEEIKNKKEKN